MYIRRRTKRSFSQHAGADGPAQSATATAIAGKDERPGPVLQNN